MKMSGNTVLITGGTSGIGLALASRFLDLGNTTIVTGRNQAKLDETKRKFPLIHIVKSDISDPNAIVSLQEKLIREFPALNIIINNAGIMRKINLHDRKNDLTDLIREIEINLMGPIRTVKQFLPHLKTKSSAAIVNVSSGLAFVPLPISPVYCAAKAGIHSFTQSLRFQLKNTNIKVFELAPPGTDTPLFSEDFSPGEVQGLKLMDVQVLAAHAMDGFKKDTYEIRPGLSDIVRLLDRIAPRYIANRLGKSVDEMLAQGKPEA
jgi:uncharacterized oxidoreductase